MFCSMEKKRSNAELKQRDKSYRDNFHAPYIKLLTYEEQISSAQMENLGVSDNEEGVALRRFLQMMTPKRSSRMPILD